MMSDLCLVCLIGIPACGKTTLSKQIRQILENQYNYNVKLICFDDYDSFNNTDVWKSKRKEIYNDVLKFIESNVNNCKNVNTVVILDDNMYYRSMRYEYVKLAKQYEIGYCQIYLETTLTSALENNRKRSFPIGEDIIKQMYNRIEKPNSENYAWESKSYIYLYPESLDKLVNLIFNSLKDPLKLTDDNFTEHHSQSDIHLADLSLRKLVSAKIKLFKSHNQSNDNISKLSRQLSLEKQNIVGSLKNGTLLLPDTTVYKEAISKNEKIELYYSFFCSLLD